MWLFLEWVSLDKDYSRAFGDRPGSPLGALVLVLSGPFGRSSVFFHFIIFI